jgi:Big-like domain-containing protein
MLNRRQVVTGAVAVAAGSLAAGCTAADASPAGRWAQPGGATASGGGGGGPSGNGSPAAAPVTVSFRPAADTNSVSPADPVTVEVTGGTLKSVTVAAGGAGVDGTLSGDGRTWRSTGTLAYGKTYTITATVVDSSGASSDRTASFSTIKPAGTAGVTFQANALNALKDGGTYGVGQIVVVHFSRAVTDKAAAQKAVEVDTSPSVEGKFFWLDKQTLHYRPEKYWASGTKINVRVNLLGVDLGGGVYGAGNASTSFTIGDSRVAVVDTQTHRMLVYVNGQQVKNFPISAGKGGTTTGANGETIDFWTRTVCWRRTRPST